jgi:hypothetical protein
MTDTYNYSNFMQQYVMSRQNIMILQILMFTFIFLFIYKLIDQIMSVKTEKFDDIYSKESRFLVTDVREPNQRRQDKKDKMNKRLTLLMRQRKPEYSKSNTKLDDSSERIADAISGKGKLINSDNRPSHNAMLLKTIISI